MITPCISHLVESKTGARLPNAPNADTTAVPAAALGGARRRPRTARQRMMRQRADDDVMEDSDQDGSDNELSQVPWKDEEGSGKIGEKKMKRLQKKKKKKEQREVWKRCFENTFSGKLRSWFINIGLSSLKLFVILGFVPLQGFLLIS